MEPFRQEQGRSSESRLGRSISLDSAASLLGVSRRTIYNRIRDNRLQTIRTAGGSQRVLVDSLGAPSRKLARTVAGSGSFEQISSERDQEGA